MIFKSVAKSLEQRVELLMFFAAPRFDHLTGYLGGHEPDNID
jgi:hypothetical protein